MQYEVLGETRTSLAEEYQVSKSQLAYAIEEQGWKRVPLAGALTDWRDLDNLDTVGEDLIDEVQERLRVMRTIKQAVLSPRYIALETAILGKALETLQVLSPENPNAAQQIKTLSDVLSSLKEQNQMTGSKEAEGAGGITVKVLSQVGPGGNVQTGTEIQITDRVGEPAI